MFIHGRSWGKSIALHAMTEAARDMSEAMKHMGDTLAQEVRSEVVEYTRRLDESIAREYGVQPVTTYLAWTERAWPIKASDVIRDENRNWGPPKLRNDGKPKRDRQTEPDYVTLTKKKRR